MSHLEVIYSNILSFLQEEKDRISTRDIDQQTPNCLYFVVLLHSSVEHFLCRCFEILIKHKLSDFADATSKIKGDLSNNKLDFDLYMSIFIPECYQKSEIWKSMKNKRNDYAHGRIFDQNGKYNLEERPI